VRKGTVPLTTPEGDKPVAAATPRPAMPSLVYSRPPEDENENFAEMFAKSDPHKTSRSAVRPGARVTGVVIQIGQDTAFLTLQEGGEAMIDLRELKPEVAEGETAPEPKVGDVVEGFVVSVGGKAGGVVVSKALSKGAANLARLEEAQASGMPVEGTVTGVNKGGLEVDLGGARGFCPISQADLRYVEKPEQFVGQKLQFKVTEVKEQDVVLSRRALLEAERAAIAERTREQLSVGARLKGKVTSLRDFGAFVDLGGVEGLIHISELSHGRVRHPSEVLQAGQDVEVEVTKIEPADPNSPDKSKHRERIGLSLRALEADPWSDIEARFPIGARVPGKVVRLQPFGAFVELAPGVDGLIHISNLSDRRIHHPKEVVSEGQDVEVVIEKVELDAKKIGLALWREGYVSLSERTAPAAEESREPRESKAHEDRPSKSASSAPAAKRPAVGDVVQATVDRIEPFGLFVSFPGGRGLIPNVEMGTPRGSDHKKQFPPGTVFKAAIIEIDNQGRLKLSKTSAEQAEERAEVNSYLEKHQPKQKGSGFGTLGDLLKAKLNK
jgi:small subunit ribosomal protein S1